MFGTKAVPVFSVSRPPGSSRVLHQLAGLIACCFFLLAAVPAARAVACEEPHVTQGEVQHINAELKNIKVGGVVIGTDQQTVIQNEHGQPIGFAQLAVGNHVEVKFCHGTPLIATLIKKKAPPASDCVAQQLKGVVTNIHPEENLLLVAGLPVKVTQATVILGREGQAITFGHLHVGMLVEVDACRLNVGFTAKKIVVRAIEGMEIGLRGPVASIDEENETFVVNGITVVSNEATKYYQRENTEPGFDDLEVGSLVELIGVRPPTIAIFPPPPITTLIAKTVHIIGDGTVPPPTGDHFHVHGYLQDVDESGTMVVAERAIQTDEETKYFDREEEVEIELGDLVPGDWLAVSGLRKEGGVLLARVVRRAEPIGVPFRFRGVIQAIEDGVFVIGERAVETDDDTRFQNIEREPITAAEFSVGEVVETVGAKYPDGRHLAKLIAKVPTGEIPQCIRNIEFGGAVASVNVGEGRLHVAGRIVHVGNTTIITNREQQRLTLADISVNDHVKIAGHQLANTVNAVAACVITVLDDHNGGIPEVTRLVGKVDSVDTPTLTFVVKGITVQTNEETVFEKRREDDQQTTFADLRAGDFVEARGNRTGEKLFLARLVRIHEERVAPPPQMPARLGGIVTSIELPALSVNDKPVVIDGPVLVTSFHGLAIRPEDIHVGDAVEVQGVKTGDAPLVARKIEVRASIISAVDATSMTLTVAGFKVRVTGITQIRERGGDELTFADLAVGDLVRIDAERVAPRVLVAKRIVRIGAPELSPPNPPFEPVTGGIDNGRPAIWSTTNNRAFGFISLSSNAFPSTPNTLYEVAAEVSSNLDDAATAPALRLRTNNFSYFKGSELIAESVGSSIYSPTTNGHRYHAFYLPAQPPTDGTRADWFVSLDLLNVGGVNAPNARFVLESLEATPIDLNRIAVAETLAEHDFSAGTNGWEFSGAPELYALPHTESVVNGTLDLAARDASTVGFWTGDTGVTATPDTLYRGRFLVRSSTTDRHRVPTFRLRLNLKSHMLASLVVITASHTAEESPSTDGRLYDVYLYVPAEIEAGEGLLAAFDILNTDPEKVDVPISLERFVLERVTIE